MKKIQYLIIVLLCMVAQGTWAQTNVATESELRNAITDGANITLTADVTLSEKLTIGSGQAVTIDLDGNKLSRSLSANENYGMVIYVNGGNLTIKDGSGDNSGQITGGRSYNGAGVLCEEGSMLTINGGTFKKNDVSRHEGDHGRGGAIFMNPNTTLTITGGVFDNNSAYNGGAIYLDGGSATISGATFKNCWVTGDGGAIYNKGTLTLSGSNTIQSNSASGYGGGLYVDATGKTFTLSGSNTIQSNSAGTNGGGIYFQAIQTINMSGNPVVSGNTLGSSTNNLYLPSNDIINCGTFESGASVGVTLQNYDRAFTSGYNSQSIDYFSADVEGATLSLNSSGEAYVSSNGGVLYMKCSWVWNDESDETKGGYVVKTQKLATSVNDFHIETDQTLTGGWYQFVGEHEYNKRIVINGDVKFILYDDCNIEFKKGIHINNGRTFTIYCQSYGSDMGKLRCTGDDGSSSNGDAAIGGNNEVVGGSLVIHGGDIYAKPSHNCAAGIGGGDGESGMQSVTIYGGTVSAEGSSSGAGIGGGNANRGPSITIYGGDVTAKGGDDAAGIGGGEDRGNSTIKIYGGTVTATSGVASTSGSGAGIGGGEEGDVDNPIYIYGGTVTAKSQSRGAGIGGGCSANVNAPIYIYGGTIEATGGSSGAGIGGGYGYNDDEKGNQDSPIYIYGGTVTATGNNGSAGIGGGYYGNGGEVVISGGTVYATGGTYSYGAGAGIGGGSKGNGGTVTINGGYVEAWGGNATQGDTTTGSSGIGAGTGSSKNGGTVTINGGTVKAGCGKKWAVPIGGYTSNGAYVDKVNLTIADDMMVTSNITGKATAANRVTVCKTGNNGDTDPYVLIEACDHSDATYSQKDATYHSVSCSYCLTSQEEHTFGDYSECGTCHLVSLADDGDNSSTISHWAGETKSVVLSGRTLYKDGYWNTLCLPFDVTDAQVTALLDGNGTLMELDTDGDQDGKQTGLDGTTLYLYFKDATQIEAGKPYIIKWSSGSNFTPTFTGVTINSHSPETVTSTDGSVSFIGNYDPMDINGSSYLYLGRGTNLYWPSTTKSINAFRAYFQLNGITAGEPNSNVRAFSLHFGDQDGNTTGIIEAEANSLFESVALHSSLSGWYDLSGRKLNAKPTQKGVYIYKGKKQVIK